MKMKLLSDEEEGDDYEYNGIQGERSRFSTLKWNPKSLYYNIVSIYTYKRSTW